MMYRDNFFVTFPTCSQDRGLCKFVVSLAWACFVRPQSGSWAVVPTTDRERRLGVVTNADGNLTPP